MWAKYAQGQQPQQSHYGGQQQPLNGGPLGQYQQSQYAQHQQYAQQQYQQPQQQYQQPQQQYQQPQQQYQQPQQQYQQPQQQYQPSVQQYQQPQQQYQQPQQQYQQPALALQQQQMAYQTGNQQRPQVPVMNSGGPQLDAKVHQQQMSFLAHATAAQFKPVKLYVLLGDKTSVSCVQMVRSNADLERQVEVVDAARPENRPTWLTGVPSLHNQQKGEYFIGPECVMWIKYQASQTLASVTESTGTSQVLPGMPAAIDGTAAMSGVLGMTSFVPQDMVADRDLLNTIDGKKAAQRFDHFVADRNQMPVIAPGAEGQFHTEQVGRGGSAEKLNAMIEATQNDRNALLNRAHVPHHMQQRMGWNPNQTQKVGRQGVNMEQMNNQLAQLQQQRDSVGVPIRQQF